MGFLGKISSTAQWLGDTVGKGVTHLSRVVSKVGPSIGKGLERFGDVVSVVGDVANLLAPVIPELAVVGEAATAIRDTSQALGRGLETGDMWGSLKEGAKQLVADEIKGLIPGGNQLDALSDLTKRAQQMVSGLSAASSVGNAASTLSNYLPASKKTKLSSLEL